MDWFLIIVAAVIAVVLLIGLGILIIYFGHPDDKNSAYFPRAMTLFGLFLACSNVLLLPFDVTNSQTSGSLNLTSTWLGVMYVTAIFLIVFIPFAYFYYENDNDPNDDTSGCCGLIKGWNGQCCEGLKWAIGFMICFGITVAIMYIFLDKADIPLTTKVYTWNQINSSTPSVYRTNDTLNDSNILETITGNCTYENITYCAQSSTTVTMTVTPPVFTLAMLAFLGWFLFVAFAGTGLIALPWDLFNDWKYRPKPIKLDKYAEEKRKLGERANLLKGAGEAIKKDELDTMGRKLSRKNRRETNETFHRFENAVYLLKRDFYHLETAYKLRGGNPFWPWIELFASVIGGTISLMWLIHIVIFDLPVTPISPCLNLLFIKLTIPGFPLFGVLAFGCYSFWLLLATVKGLFRFGLRIPFCRVFPMEWGNTLMNAFLANTWLVLLCSIVVVQFCATSFPVYARDTSIDMLFGTQIRYLRFFKYFFNNKVFIYAFFIWSVLAGFALCFCPRRESKRIEDELKTIMKGKKDIRMTDLELAAAR